MVLTIFLYSFFFAFQIEGTVADANVWVTALQLLCVSKK